LYTVPPAAAIETERVLWRELRSYGRQALPQNRRQRAVVCPEQHACVGARRAVVSFVGQYRDNERLRTLRVKTIGKTLAGGG